MFGVGDKVVYPMYGAGVIEELEHKFIDGAEQTYYVMRIPVGNLKIFVSVKNAESLGIREIMDSESLTKTISEVKEKPIVMDENWNKRYRDNMEKIKTGKMSEVVEVYRNLHQRENQRGLSNAEKKVLSTAKQIILSEIILSHNVTKSEAELILEATIRSAN